MSADIRSPCSRETAVRMGDDNDMVGEAADVCYNVLLLLASVGIFNNAFANRKSNGVIYIVKET